jgi:hypothetical protein
MVWIKTNALSIPGHRYVPEESMMGVFDDLAAVLGCGRN